MEEEDPLFSSYYWQNPPSTLQLTHYVGPFDAVIREIKIREAAWAKERKLEPIVLRRARLAALRDACRSVYLYEKLNRIEEGSYGVVFRAKCLDSEEVVAVKGVKL